MKGCKKYYFDLISKQLLIIDLVNKHYFAL